MMRLKFSRLLNLEYVWLLIQRRRTLPDAKHICVNGLLQIRDLSNYPVRTELDIAAGPNRKILHRYLLEIDLLQV